MSLNRGERSKHAERRRIARARDKATIAKIRARMIRERRTTCHLCGERIDLEADQFHSNSFTLDHLDPVALSDASYTRYGDVAPAHRKCNRARGTKSVEAARLELRGLGGVTLPREGEYIRNPNGGGFLDWQGNRVSREW